MGYKVPDILKLCTMTTEKMLRIAVHEHQKAFYGKLPKRIEMHPAVFDSLVSDPHYARSVQFTDVIKGYKNFHGIPIVIDIQATRLKLINVRNEVVYI